MSRPKRPFNQELYDMFDYSNKKMLKDLIESTTNYRVVEGMDNELYKKGDLVFSNGKKTIIFENETRGRFDEIVEKWDSIHIPLRKQKTPADFYIVWKPDFLQFILIDKKTLNKYRNNIVHDIKCASGYVEDFIDVDKSETTWYCIGKDYKLQKVPY
jgi:hypothetical protein